MKRIMSAKRAKWLARKSPQSLCSGIGDKAERWAGACGEEHALERGGRVRGSPAGSAIWCMAEPLLARPELTSLAAIPESAEG